VVAPDLPADESANLQTYADTVIEAIGSSNERRGDCVSDLTVR
jgi:hypothetical protein